MVEIILSHLIFDQAYFSKVWPYMDSEYFESGPAKNTFKLIKSHVNEYHSVPSINALNVALENSSFTEISNDINHRNIKIVIEEFVLSTLEHKSFNINIFLQYL